MPRAEWLFIPLITSLKSASLRSPVYFGRIIWHTQPQTIKRLILFSDIHKQPNLLKLALILSWMSNTQKIKIFFMGKFSIIFKNSKLSREVRSFYKVWPQSGQIFWDFTFASRFFNQIDVYFSNFLVIYIS